MEMQWTNSKPTTHQGSNRTERNGSTELIHPQFIVAHCPTRQNSNSASPPRHRRGRLVAAASLPLPSSRIQPDLPCAAAAWLGPASSPPGFDSGGPRHRPHLLSPGRTQFLVPPRHNPPSMASAAAAAAASVAGGAELGGFKPNPSADGPSLRPPGKPVALADITNTGRPNPPRSVHVADALKENAKLVHMLREKTKFVEASKVEMHKLRLMLHTMHQQNMQLAQTNSQILAELNQGKDRLKVLQHELGCTKATLKVKASEHEKKTKIANRPQKKVHSKEEIKTIPSELAPIEALQIDNRPTSARAHHSVETQSAVPSNTGSQEPTQDKINKRKSESRRSSKRKSESCEAIKDTITVQHICKPHSQSSESLCLEDPRKTQRRRSSRLNPGSCEVTEVPYETLHEEAVVPSAFSSFGVPKTHEPNAEKDTIQGESLQNGVPCTTTELEAKASELKKSKPNMQSQKGMDLEEIQESCPLSGVEAYQIGGKATNNNPDHLTGTQSSLPNIEHPEPPQEKGDERKSARGANKQMLELCEGPKNSSIEDINAIYQSSSGGPLHDEEKRKYPRRKSARLNPEPWEVAKGVFETLHEDIANPVAQPRSDVLIEQSKNEQDSSMKPSEEQVAGRRSSVGRPSRRATEKIVSYKETSLKVKMRRE